MPATLSFRYGFTLVELLVSITIIGILAALLFPVFAKARESAHCTACLSNERQIGVAILEYATDNDASFPSNQTPNVNGIWAKQVFPYVKSADVYRCPDDLTEEGKWDGDVYSVDSYGLNRNLTANEVYVYTKIGATLKPTLSVSESALVAPSRTVLAFEIAGGTAALGNLSADRHLACAATGNGVPDPASPNDPFANGCRPDAGKIYFGVRYATGLLGARRNDMSGPVFFESVAPRHMAGANYLACDGHVVSLPPASVSGGQSQPAGGANCNEDAISASCGGKNTAAGTAVTAYGLTFSIR